MSPKCMCISSFYLSRVQNIPPSSNYLSLTSLTPSFRCLIRAFVSNLTYPERTHPNTQTHTEAVFQFSSLQQNVTIIYITAKTKETQSHSGFFISHMQSLTGPGVLTSSPLPPPNPSYHHQLPGIEQYPPFWSLFFYFCLPPSYFPHSMEEEKTCNHC